MNACLDPVELRELGLTFGEGTQISRKASIYGAERIRVGDNVRIDDFCVLSAGEGGITIGSHVHIAVFTSLIGKGRITVADYANLSSRVAVYSSSDDYSGEWMTNPTVPAHLTRVDSAPVVINRHVIIGSGSVILPGVVLEEGVAVGALSLVRSSCEAFGIYVGAPARLVSKRSRRLLELEREHLPVSI